jgi:acyl carrier protein
MTFLSMGSGKTVYLRQNFFKNSNFFQKSLIMASISERVTKIIVDKLGVDESEVKHEASFTNVELIMEFEKEFGVNIPDDQAENIGTVGQAIEYLTANAA